MSQLKIYVGNLSYDTTQDDLNSLFGEHGKISEVKLITDRETGRSKGFAFITFNQPDGAQAAMTLNGAEFQGRRLKVNIARDNNSRGGGRREGNGGGGGRRRW